jgi:hypothetical protein
LINEQPLNQLLLRVDKALNDELITDSGIKLYLDPTYRKEWTAAVTATVTALPIKSVKKDVATLNQLSVGDEVAMSYMVVSDLEFKGDGLRFAETTEENRYVQEYANGKGDRIRCYALPSRKGLADTIWVGAYTDKFGNLIDGVQGTEKELERWKSQFEFGKTDIYNHINLFSYKGSDHWKCSPSQVFAKRVDGHIVAIGDRIICTPVEEDVPAAVKLSLNYKDDVKIRYQDRGVVLASADKRIKKGYTVSFKPGFCEKYTLWGKDYFLIKNRYVEGIWSKN